jgi:hypothetical protein
VKKYKLLPLFFFLLLFAALGYFREYFFVQINNIMYMKYYHITSPLAVGRVMLVFERMDYDLLYYLKYPFTIIWTAIFFASNYFFLKTISGQQQFLKLLIWSYVTMLFIAACSMAYGYLFHDRLQSDEYTLSRWLLGIAQSPIVGLILLATEKLYLSSREQR